MKNSSGLVKRMLAVSIAMVMLTLSVLAQVGINSDNSAPDPSAMLDVKSPAKGLLPPRVNLTATNVAGPVSSPAIGLQVYNTSTAGTSPYNVTPGIYSWDGTQWIPVIAPKGANVGDMQYWNGVQWITVPIGVPGQILQILPTGIPAWNGSAYAAITTNAATNITASSAMSGGTISSDGGSAITAKGVCYNTLPNPTIANMKVTGGTGTGSFSSSMSGLLAGTTYYVRAYATNSAGTSYGNEISFTTIANATLPTVTTTAVSNITAISATSGGTVNNAGGATVTARGVCWSTSPNPTTANSKTSNGTGIGGFASTLSSLIPNTTYYVRAYATNSAGTGYGNELTFTTLCANPVAASVSITTSANPVCAGSSVTFTATPTNGGASPVYQWKLNGANVGTNSATYTFTPVNNDVVTCLLTSNLACVTGNPVTSNAITMTVNPMITPSVSIEASTNPVCDGSLVSISATPTNGGIVPVYQWKLNGDNAGTNNSVFSYYPANGDSVYCILTSSHPCTSGPVASNGIIITVNPMVAVGITIAASANNVCAGTGVTFTSTTTNSGTYETYQWKNGGIAINGATNATYNYVPANNDVITCVYTSNPTCTLSGPVTSNAITMTVNAVPSSPASGTDLPSQNQIQWNWTSVIGATGYKWHTTNDYESATDMGTATTKIETGLTCNTSYTRFAWAYNGCENSSVLSLAQATLTCTFSCGDSLTINHVVGDVAPVTKTATYGTVSNIPGEPTKCWITSNLGSDHQATAVYDDTEASGGWYWQFNRQQGYKYDGTTRTPNTIWNNNITENSDWITASDPCNIELGTTWRIPTYSEWFNVDNIGGWTNWNGPWGSGLKLHAAGVVDYSDGSLYYRGAGGDYWSSTQGGATYGWYLGFDSGASGVSSNLNKAYGFSARCIRDCAASPTSPSSSTHTPTQTQIIWNWNTVIGATGYKWSITDDYANATDMGTATTKTETGLTCNTAYTRYVWSYSACENSTPVTLTQSTSACPPLGCGTVTVNHTAGVVAPVTKSVTYGTVTNIPGEPTKCWITSNLGSDHQATAVDDATEASAGWYWQFNRKQGYKNDGSSVTPLWTITNINESSDWIITNDPCYLEIGTGWRIPTYTEWTNVNIVGGWTSWNGPWGSGLNLHAAGYLYDSNGSLATRGLHGSYWSSTQNGIDIGLDLYFGSGYSDMGNGTKAGGQSVRCLRDN